MYDCFAHYVSMDSVYAVPLKAKKDSQISSWNWKKLWVIIWVLGIKLTVYFKSKMVIKAVF